MNGQNGNNHNGNEHEPVSIKKFLFVGWESLSGDLAWQIKKEGHEVKIYVKSENDKDVYEGFLERVDDWQKHVDWADVIVFDDVGFGKEADDLRKKGKSVVGGSEYTDKLEQNREFGQGEMKKVGMLTLPHWDFSDYDLALKFIEENPGRYVYKPSGSEQSNSKGLLFIGKDEDGKDLHEIIRSNKKVLQTRVKQFQLQKFVQGVEIAVGAFFNGNDFIYPININFEHKKLFPGDIGPFTGEMGCYDDKTEVLTNNGWKFFKNLLKTDKICTLNPKENDSIEFHEPEQLVKFNNHKELISVQNQTLDIMVTPDHNMYLCSQNNFRKNNETFKFIKARDMEFQSIIKRTGNWLGIEKKYFILSKIEKYHREGKEVVSHEVSAKRINMNDWLEFLGIWISDGSVSANCVAVCQKNKNKTRIIEKMLKKLPFAFSGGKDVFYIYDKQLAAYLRPFGKAPEKYVPLFVKELSKNQIEIFLKWYCLGDGIIMKNGYRIFYTCSRRLANDVQELLLKIKKVGIIKEREPRGKTWIVDHFVDSKRIQYEIHERVKKSDSWIDKRDIKKIKYKGVVYCAVVKNHIMYVRRNGKPYWCGNTLMYWSGTNIIFKTTLERMKEDIKKSGYVGYIDINCIANGRGIYPLEFTARFGYPTISIQMEGVISEWGEFLYSIAKGEQCDLKTKRGFQIGVVCATPPWPYNDKTETDIYRDLSIIFKKPNLDGIHLGDVKLIEGNWQIAGHLGYDLVITGSGVTVEDARKQVYSRIENILLQNMFYRTDIGLGWYEDSDKLQTWGYLY